MSTVWPPTGYTICPQLPTCVDCGMRMSLFMHKIVNWRFVNLFAIQNLLFASKCYIHVKNSSLVSHFVTRCISLINHLVITLLFFKRFIFRLMTHEASSTPGIGSGSPDWRLVFHIQIESYIGCGRVLKTDNKTVDRHRNFEIYAYGL